MIPKFIPCIYPGKSNYPLFPHDCPHDCLVEKANGLIQVYFHGASYASFTFENALQLAEAIQAMAAPPKTQLPIPQDNLFINHFPKHHVIKAK